MKKNIVYSVIFLMSIALFYGCGESESSTIPRVETQTYSTTSTKGDYTEWSINDEGTVHAVWQVINTRGGTDYTHTFDARCASPTTTGLQSCNFTTVSCSAGLLACPPLPSGSFSMMNIPDVAIFVETDDGVTRQLHVGFVKDDNACSEDVSGDYVSMHLGLGKRDIFGLYRSDENFINISHADFGFETSDANVHQTLSYNTGRESAILVDKGCVDGVREREIAGGLVRSMMTKSGLFVLDLPAGQGGMLSFKVQNSATLEEIANKNFGGYVFPDNTEAVAISLSSSAVIDNRVNWDTLIGEARMSLRIMPLGTSDSMTSPAYPSFSSSPTDYTRSTLFSSYTTPSNISGFYKLDGLNDDERVIISALKHNGKIVLLGGFYNYRTLADINPATGSNFRESGLYNTGSFILFEQ